MKNRHRFGLVFLAAVWLGSVAIVSGAETFRVGFPSLATGFAPSWVAADKGIWKKHGLDVELIFLRGGSRTVSALIGGSVDFIIGSDLGITTAILQGAALTRSGDHQHLRLLHGQPTGDQERARSQGKVIGITPGRDAAYARVVKLLRDNGMDSSKDVSYLSVGDGGPAARVAALSSGVIHATMFTPPSDMISEKAGMRILTKIDVANIGGGLNTSTINFAKEPASAFAFSARLHGSDSIHEVAQGRELENFFQIRAQPGPEYHGLSLRRNFYWVGNGIAGRNPTPYARCWNWLHWISRRPSV